MGTGVGRWACRPCRSTTVKSWRHDVSEEAIRVYGGKCNCCGETERAFLEIDHIDGGGNQHRKDEKIQGGNSLAVWLKRNNWPEGFQILCANCNKAKERPGGCPHQNPERKAGS